MNICYVANSRFPSERAHMTQIVAMCNAFVEKGHEVTLLVTDRATHVTESPENFFGVPILFQTIRVCVPDIAGASPKIPVFLRPYLYSIQRLFFAYRAAKKIKQDRTYTYVYGRDEWVLWLLTFLTDVKIVWESHEARYSYAGKRLLRAHVPLIAISEGIRDFYVTKGILENDIHVAHDAVDGRFFEQHSTTKEARAFLSMAPQKPVVMYIGGLEKWKGVETLCRASKEQSDFEVYVVGGKEKEIASYKAAYPQVHFLGPRPYRELPIIQQAADILVIPNTAKDLVSEKYTSPLKLFTYMTSKKPIVASRIPSIERVVGDNDVFFFEADNAGDLRKTILHTLDDVSAVQRKIMSSHKKSFMHTWPARADNIVSFLVGAR